MLAWLKANRWWLAGGVVVVAASLPFFLPKIALQRELLVSGKAHQEDKQWSEAVDDFERTVRYAPRSSAGLEAARLGGGICLYELKDYQRAIFFFRHIVRHGQNPNEVQWAQEKLGEVYNDKLNNYPQAVVEYQRLLQAQPAGEEAAHYRLKLGRAYFYMANFDQAISESQEFLSKNPASSLRFEFLVLQGDSLLAQKKSDQAVAVYQMIEKEFPKNPEIPDVIMSESVAYEDKSDWDSAMAKLEDIKDTYAHPDVVELKIKSIQRRKEKKRE